MMKRKNIKSFLCFAACIFILTGCSETANKSSNVEIQKRINETAYKVHDIELNTEIQNLRGNIAVNNGLFYSCYNYNSIIVFDELGNIQSTIPISENFEKNEYCGINENIFVDGSGNITCMTGNYNYITGEAEFYDKIVRCDASGKTLSSIDLNKIITREEADKGIKVIGFISDDKGNIYLNLQKYVRVIDCTGNVLFTTEEIDSEINSFIMTNLNTPAINICNSGENLSNKLVEIDLNTKGYGKEYILPSNITDLYSGVGDYICCIGTSTGIAGIRSDTLEQEEVINFLNIGVDNSQIYCMTMFGNDSFIIKGADSSKYVNPIKISLITPMSQAEEEEKKILTLGCFSLDLDNNINSQIADFNRKNEEYSISVNCYSDTNDITDWNTALSNFNLEIISGNVPDILLITMPYDSYTSKGLFADIYEIMEADGEFTKEDFLPNILNALETDGKLYSVCADFTVQTCAVKKDIMNGKSSMTMEDAKKYLSELEERALLFDEPFTSDAFVYSAVKYNDFVDYRTASCSFDTPKFKRILEYAKEFPSEIDYEKLKSENPSYQKEMQMYCGTGKALLSLENFGSYSDYNKMKKVYFNDDTALIGFPEIDEGGCTNGNLSLGTRYAISERSEYKEGAWQFIKSVIKGTVTEHDIPNFSGTLPKSEYEGIKMYLNRSGKLPVLDDQLNKLAVQATIPNYYINYDGELAEMENAFYVNGTKKVLDPLNSEEADEFTEYIKSVSHSDVIDTSIMNIINEETALYFDGVKSADETASAIQSRVDVYLNEQYN